MKAKITITLKNGVLDPQGKAIEHGLGSLGFNGVEAARQGKYIELDLRHTDKELALKDVTQMCEKLLSNTVIEKYSIQIEG
jgi:phosphoribosylformylglycinamidine synthase